MKVECDHCGAPFEVAAVNAPVTCPYCGRLTAPRRSVFKLGQGPGLKPIVLVAIVAGLGLMVTMISTVAFFVSASPSGPAPSPAPVPSAEPAAVVDAGAPEPEPLVVSYTAGHGPCMVDANGDDVMDLAGLFAWSDATSRYQASIADGATGELIFRGQEVPYNGAHILCGHGGVFGIGAPDFKLHVFQARGDHEKSTVQLPDKMIRWQAGSDCFALELVSGEGLYVGFDGAVREDCQVGVLPMTLGAPKQANELLAGHVWDPLWMGTQDGRTYQVEVPRQGTKFITVRAFQGDASKELEAALTAHARVWALRPRPHAERMAADRASEKAGKALAARMEGMTEVWNVRLPVASSISDFRVTLTPNTLVVGAADPTTSEGRLVGVGLTRGSVRYTLEVEDVFSLQYNGRYVIMDGRGENSARDPDTGEVRFTFGA